MFDIRVREYTPAGVKGRVIPTIDIDETDAESATATMTFTTSSRVADRLEAPFVVGLEYTTGSSWSRPRNDLFIVLEDAENAADQTDVMQFKAQSYVGWLLSQAVLWWTRASKDNRTRPFDMTPGQTMRTLIAEAQGTTSGVDRGWAPTLTYDFTNTADSLGQAWQAADRIKMTLDLWKPYSTFVQMWVEQGHFEWWAEGMRLRIARVGSGANRTDSLVLGGPAFSSAPAKTDFKGTFSTIVLIPDKMNATHAYNSGADKRFGALETSMSLSGVGDRATALRQAQPVMQENRAKKLELSYDWTPDSGGPTPWRDFTIGDTVTARRKNGKQPLRVIGIQVSKSGGSVTVRAIVGSKLVGLSAKLAKRVGAIAQGTIIGGSGASFPSSPGPAPLQPAAPGAVRVESNLGTWGDDGRAVSTVRIAWDEVATDVEGNPLDVDRYQVWSRRGNEAPVSTGASTSGLSVTFDTWTPGEPRYVSVRARSVTGRWSDLSAEIAVVPAVPESVVPRPVTELKVLSNTGAFQADGTAAATVSVEWEPVQFSVDDQLVTIAEYELRVGLTAVRVVGTSASFTIATKETVSVAVRALSNLGIWGDPSEPVDVTGAEPPATIAAPTPPVLLTGVGQVAARWAGDLVTGVPPAGFGFVYMETAASEDGPWSPFGTPLTGAGGANIKGIIGETVWVRLRSSDTLGRSGGVSDPRSIVVEGVTGPDIEANAVTANHIEAGSIGVNHVTPSFGNDLNLSANESVTIVVGRQDAQAELIADLGEGVELAQNTAAGAANAAGDAQATADGAAEIAADAAATASDVGQRLDQHQTYYRFGTDGLAIGDPKSTAEVRLKPDRIEMTQNSVVVSYWEGGVFVAEEARLNSAQIGNHQFMAYGPGRTIVRPL
ncbi:hypothetical protein D8M34_05815 [Microbacterium sp. HSID17254]|uniref:hypothetical protein n=1 Tax=Microbacterium sp. HSID17254 TaxID=2419509 RepID=UPI000F8783EE|nr:hypothetical protein [Microbacterium sp. HSID17254]RUQ06985.1 hypothetical protein D8M34_05815 [Microbacterium sp. HSID17254]